MTSGIPRSLVAAPTFRYPRSIVICVEDSMICDFQSITLLLFVCLGRSCWPGEGEIEVE